MIVEFIGMKNGKIVRRFKEDCTQVDYDEDNMKQINLLEDR